MIAVFSEGAVLFLRGAVGLAGALVGWLLGGVVGAVLYRLAFQKPIPKFLSPWAKLAGALLLGLCLFYFAPIGGIGGWGLFGGGGTGASDGGSGGGKSGDSSPGSSDSSNDATKTPTNPNVVRKGTGDPQKLLREVVAVELLGGERYKGDDRYYMIGTEDKAKTLAELATILEPRASKIEVHVIRTKHSVASQHGASIRLREKLNQLNIPIVESPMAPSP